MASTTIWRGQTATLSITDSSDADVPIGILQDVEVSTDFEVNELFGSGSTKRQDVSKVEHSVSVSGTVSAWDLDSWKTLIDYDDVNDVIDDSADMPLFTVTLNITKKDGESAEIIEIKNVYFEGVPISGSRDEYIELSLEGKGDDIEFNPSE